jgi:hypothetical protein
MNAVEESPSSAGPSKGASGVVATDDVVDGGNPDEFSMSRDPGVHLNGALMILIDG